MTATPVRQGRHRSNVLYNSGMGSGVNVLGQSVSVLFKFELVW